MSHEYQGLNNKSLQDGKKKKSQKTEELWWDMRTKFFGQKQSLSRARFRY